MQSAMTSVFLLLSFGSAAAIHMRTKTSSEKVSEAKKPVFYMTAMAKLASKHQTRLWLSTIRQVGKYDGEIVMVTDKADCLAKNLGEKLLGGPKIQEKSTEAVDVYPGGENKGHVYMVKVPTTTNVKEMKQQKAKAWQNIRTVGLKPSYIVHTDQDIVFGDELKSFLQTVDVLDVTGDTPNLALFVDQGVTKGQLHTGIVVMFPGEKTETCLNEWGAKILKTKSSKYHGLKDSHTEVVDFDGELTETAGAKMEAEFFGPDQRALATVKSCKAGKGIVKMAAQYLMMPTGGALAKGARAAFVHFTNTNRWKSIKNPTMQKYFSTTLGLDAGMDFFEYETC